MKKNAIPDTNIFLHYDILSVDWCGELGADEVEIVVCSTVLRELDKKKTDGNPNLAERATRNLSLIESHNADKTELRKSVTLSAVLKEPKIQWDDYGLDSSLNDDRILGFILERNDTNDVLITNDSTPRLKGKELGVSTLKLRYDMLPLPKSEEQKELEKTRADLLRFQNRVPELTIELISAEKTKDGLPKYIVKTNHDLPEDDVMNMLSIREKELALNVNRSLFPAIDSMFIDIPTYNKDVKKHLKSYQEYIAAKNLFDKQMSTILKMEFVLSCMKAPSDNINCHIEIPEELQIVDEDDLPKVPSEPERPNLMNRFASLSALNRMVSMPGLNPSMFDLTRDVEEKNVRVGIDSNTIYVKINRINHGLKIDLYTVYVKLPSVEAARPFEISYSIHAPNLIDPIKKKIPVIVEKIE